MPFFCAPCCRSLLPPSLVSSTTLLGLGSKTATPAGGIPNPKRSNNKHHFTTCCMFLQIGSIEEADAKMEELAKAGKIDPAFLQISAKAYGAARDTNMTLEEAK